MIKQVDNDEIDIVLLLKNVISFTKKASKHIAISLIVGIAIGLLIYINTPPFYESQIGFYSDNLSDKKLYSLMSDVDKFLASNDTNQLAKVFNLKTHTVKKITSMKVSTVQEIESVENGDQKENGIIVTFRVTDNTVFDSLERGIKFYVENTDFVKNRLLLHKEGLIYNIDKISKEIRDLDLLKADLNSSLTKGGKSNLFISDFGNTGAKLVEFYEKQSNLKNQLQLVSDVRVFKSFSKYNRKAGPRMSKYILYSVIIALGLGLFLYVFPSMRRFVIEA